MPTSGTRVDFYLLSDNSLHSVRVFSCRLAEKAWQLGHRVWIRTDDAQASDQLDNVLWTFSDNSFLPHAKVGDADADTSPILIGELAPRIGVDLLINLGSEIPEYCDAFARIAEIIDSDAVRKQQGRTRYAHYAKSNYTLQHHTIN